MQKIIKNIVLNSRICTSFCDVTNSVRLCQGLGESRKSSANPDLLKSLSDVFIHLVAYGKVFVFIAAWENKNGDSKMLEKLPSIDRRYVRKDALLTNFKQLIAKCRHRVFESQF